MADLKSWLQKGLTKDGVTAAKVADALGTHYSAVYKLVKGERRFRPDELPKIAQVIGEPIPVDPGNSVFSNKKFVTIPVECGLSAGEWTRSDKADGVAPLTITVPRDEHFPKAQHLAYRVAGESLKDSGILDGDIVFAIAFEGMGGYESMREGMFAVVERTRRNITERCIKAVTKTKESFVLQSGKGGESIVLLAPTTKPSIVSPLRIVAIVRSVTRNFA